MMQKNLSRALLLFLLALSLSMCFWGCGDSDDADGDTDGDAPATDGDAPEDGDDPTDGDNPTDGDDPTDGDEPDRTEDEAELETILNAIVEAIQTQTESAFNTKMEPNLSDNYDWAGCNKFERMAIYKQSADPNEALEITLIDTEIVFDEDRATITADYDVSLSFSQGSMSEIGAAGSGTYSITLDCIQETEAWKVLAIKSGLTAIEISGGPEGKIPAMSDLVVDSTDSLEPGSTIHITGSLAIPALAENERFTGVLAMEWDSRMDNVEQGGIEEELFWTVPEDASGNFAIDITLPTEGVGTHTLPDMFQKSRDTVQLVLVFMLEAQSEDESYDSVALLQYMYEIPLANFDSE